ncbi:conjugal transfer protein TraR [Escherichia coli]|nr:conjugal transfer protein TraR [Escherichia coli]
MPRIRVTAACVYAAIIHAQLFFMTCRSKLIERLLLIPVMLLPKAVLADGDLADIVSNASAGAKSSEGSLLTIARFIGVVLFIGAIIGFKKVGKQGGMGLAACISSLIIGVFLVALPEMMNRSQRQLGISTISIG